MNRVSRRGWLVWDLAALLAVLAVVGAVLVVVMSRSRAMGQLTASIRNLREQGSAAEAYARDNANRVATFSWKKGDMSSQFPDLKNPATDLDAAAFQAVDIIRRRTPLTMAQFPRVSSWIPHVSFGSLVLTEYLDQATPWATFASPGDAKLRAWAADPLSLPLTDTGTLPHRRTAFSSSYEIGPAWWDSSPDQVNAVSQSTTHRAFTVPGGATFGNRDWSQVTFPSHKSLLYERHQWYFGAREGFFMYDEARVPVLAADQSAQVRRSKNVNKGWQANSWHSTSYTTTQYAPAGYEPKALAGTSETVIGHLRWTRSGLGGRDFDGAEVPWP